MLPDLNQFIRRGLGRKPRASGVGGEELVGVEPDCPRPQRYSKQTKRISCPRDSATFFGGFSSPAGF
jgi:hypothetical protein